MKKVAIVVVLLIAGFFISKTITDSAIREGAANLQNYGVECKITKDSGFFTQTKEYDLKVTDGKKFAISLLKAYGEVFKEFRNLTTKLAKEADSEKINEVLEKFDFKGSIVNSNLNPFADVDVNLYLSNIKDLDLSKDKNLFIIKQILDKKLINFDIIVSKSGNLQNLKLKDIDEKFINDKKELNTKITGFDVINKSSSDDIKGDMNIKNISISALKHSRSNFVADLNDLNYNVNYKNQFNNNGTMSFEKLHLGDGRDEFLEFGKSLLYADVATNGDKFDLSMKTGINDIKADFGSQKGGLKKSDINIKISDLDLATYKKLNELSIQMITKAMDAKTPEELDELSQLDKQSFQLFQELASKGLKANLKFDLQELDFASMNIKNVNLVSGLSLKPTDFTALASPAGIKSVDLTADLTMTKEDFELIKKLAPRNFAAMAGQFVNLTGDKATVNLIVKDGSISVNGKKIM